MVEVVTTVFTASFFPREGASGLVLHHDALFELSVVVFATVSPVHGNKHGVQFVLSVFAGFESVGGHTSVVEKE